MTNVIVRLVEFVTVAPLSKSMEISQKDALYLLSLLKQVKPTDKFVVLEND